MNFGPPKEAEIFKKLAYKSALQVGLEFGYDKMYRNNKAVRDAVNKVKYKIQNNPDKYREFGITDDVIGVVRDAAQSRSVTKDRTTGEPTMAEKEIQESTDIRSIVTRIRDKAFTAIDKKLDTIAKSRKKLNEISFKELGTIAGIAFDKSQILQGKATEHVAVMSRIDKSMSPQDALEAVAKMREINAEKNQMRK